MDALSAFGLFAVTLMVICYALEDRSRWYILGFAFACVLGSIYGFLQGRLAIWRRGSRMGGDSRVALEKKARVAN